MLWVPTGGMIFDPLRAALMTNPPRGGFFVRGSPQEIVLDTLLRDENCLLDLFGKIKDAASSYGILRSMPSPWNPASHISTLLVLL